MHVLYIEKFFSARNSIFVALIKYMLLNSIKMDKIKIFWGLGTPQCKCDRTRAFVITKLSK